jgi:serine/threonine-protein kinase
VILPLRSDTPKPKPSDKPDRTGRVGTTVLGAWHIDHRIARGGVATVYAATHVETGARAAAKIMHPELCRNPEIAARFRREALVANCVAHPSVVHILDDGVTDDGAGVLMLELLQGELLEARRLKFGGRLPLIEVVRYSVQMLDVLQAAHDAGIIHRDIKPDNLFLENNGRLRVMDFGVARFRPDGFSSNRPDITMPGALLGTPDFMAPEQALGLKDQIGPHSDIWSAGATMFRLLSGDVVHEHQNMTQLLIAATTQPARPINTVRRGLPLALRETIDRALAFEKDKRWPSAGAMRDSLLPLLKGQGTEHLVPPRAARKSMRPEKPKSIRPSQLPSEEMSSGIRRASFAPGPGSIIPPAPPEVRLSIMPDPTLGPATIPAPDPSGMSDTSPSQRRKT